MFCSQCGKYLTDDSAFCDQCGVPTQPIYPPVVPAPVAMPQEPKQPSMKWFGFLIYFYLFASSTLCMLDGVLTLLGTHHENAALLYSVMPGLQALDISFGVMYVLLGIFGVLTRFRLSGRYRNGPKFLMIFFIADCAWRILFLVGSLLFQPLMTPAIVVSEVLSEIISMAPSIVLLFVNLAYFKKRKHLFTK